MNLLEDVYRLKHIKRYSTVPCIHKESVAEHGFFVGIIVMSLGHLYKFNVPHAVCLAICHDLPELELNDCPHVIKAKYPQIAEAYRVSEASVLKQFPGIIRDYVEEYNSQNTVESKITRLADVMQCIQYTEGEIKLGNKGYMDTVLQRSKQRVWLLQKELKSYER